MSNVFVFAIAKQVYDEAKRRQAAQIGYDLPQTDEQFEEEVDTNQNNQISMTQMQNNQLNQMQLNQMLNNQSNQNA